MLKKGNKKAQSTLEYLVVLTAIAALIIVAAKSFIKPSVEKSLNSTVDAMNRLSTRMP